MIEELIHMIYKTFNRREKTSFVVNSNMNEVFCLASSIVLQTRNTENDNSSLKELISLIGLELLRSRGPITMRRGIKYKVLFH